MQFLSFLLDSTFRPTFHSTYKAKQKGQQESVLSIFSFLFLLFEKCDFVKPPNFAVEHEYIQHEESKCDPSENTEKFVMYGRKAGFECGLLYRAELLVELIERILVGGIDVYPFPGRSHFSSKIFIKNRPEWLAVSGSMR